MVSALVSALGLVSGSVLAMAHHHSWVESYCRSVTLPARSSNTPAATARLDLVIAHLPAAESAACAHRSWQRKPAAPVRPRPSHCPASPSHSTRSSSNPPDLSPPNS